MRWYLLYIYNKWLRVVNLIYSCNTSLWTHAGELALERRNILLCGAILFSSSRTTLNEWRKLKVLFWKHGVIVRIDIGWGCMGKVLLTLRLPKLYMCWFLVSQEGYFWNSHSLDVRLLVCWKLIFILRLCLFRVNITADESWRLRFIDNFRNILRFSMLYEYIRVAIWRYKIHSQVSSNIAKFSK